MQYDHHIIRPPAQGGIAYVEPAKRLQQWLQGRSRDDRRDRRPGGSGGAGN
jgi:hypothetical protein